MTLRELYAAIGGDYDRAMKVLRIEKLLDKHIRKLPANGIFAGLAAAGDAMDPAAIFESAHAIKGVSSNLGLVDLSEAASGLAEEFRPGNERKLSDAEVAQRIAAIGDMFRRACEGVAEYEKDPQ